MSVENIYDPLTDELNIFAQVYDTVPGPPSPVPGPPDPEMGPPSNLMNSSVPWGWIIGGLALFLLFAKVKQ